MRSRYYYNLPLLFVLSLSSCCTTQVVHSRAIRSNRFRFDWSQTLTPLGESIPTFIETKSNDTKGNLGTPLGTQPDNRWFEKEKDYRKIFETVQNAVSIIKSPAEKEQAVSGQPWFERGVDKLPGAPNSVSEAIEKVTKNIEIAKNATRYVMRVIAWFKLKGRYVDISKQLQALQDLAEKTETTLRMVKNRVEQVEQGVRFANSWRALNTAGTKFMNAARLGSSEALAAADEWADALKATGTAAKPYVDWVKDLTKNAVLEEASEVASRAFLVITYVEIMAELGYKLLKAGIANIETYLARPVEWCKKYQSDFPDENCDTWGVAKPDANQIATSECQANVGTFVPVCDCQPGSGGALAPVQKCMKRIVKPTNSKWEWIKSKFKPTVYLEADELAESYISSHPFASKRYCSEINCDAGPEGIASLAEQGAAYAVADQFGLPRATVIPPTPQFNKMILDRTFNGQAASAKSSKQRFDHLWPQKYCSTYRSRVLSSLQVSPCKACLSTQQQPKVADCAKESSCLDQKWSSAAACMVAYRQTKDNALFSYAAPPPEFFLIEGRYQMLEDAQECVKRLYADKTLAECPEAKTYFCMGDQVLFCDCTIAGAPEQDNCMPLSVYATKKLQKDAAYLGFCRRACATSGPDASVNPGKRDTYISKADEAAYKQERAVLWKKRFTDRCMSDKSRTVFCKCGRDKATNKWIETDVCQSTKQAEFSIKSISTADEKYYAGPCNGKCLK